MVDTEVVRTARAVLRPWRDDEAPLLLDILRRREVTQWLGNPTPMTTVAEAQQQIREWRDQWAPPLGRRAIVPLDTGAPVGTVTLKQLPGDTEIEIGWHLHPASMGQGWASEAARAMLEEASRTGIERVWAVMWPHNTASAAVARAIGMAELGVRHDPWYGEPPTPESLMFQWRANPAVGTARQSVR